MGLTLPAVPNLNVQQPQIANPLDQYGKMLQLKNLMGQQQLLPLQVQEAQERVKQEQTANEMQQLELNSQQAMMKAWSDPKFLDKFTGTDKAGSSGLGFDPDALSSSLISQGVLPKDAMSMTQMFVDRSQKIAATAKDVSQAGEAQASLREKGFKTLADRIGGVLDAPASKAGDLLAQLKQDLVKNKDAFAGVPQEDLAHVYGADLEHLPSMATLIGLDAKLADYHKSKAEAAKAQQGVIPEGAKMSPEQTAEANKQVAVETNPQVVASKEAVAAAEGAARANIEVGKKREEMSDTQYQTAIGADERLNRMEKSYTDAVKNHNQQAMLALLTDHIGMTLGLQKGARITKDILNEATNSQPWLAKMEAKFDSDGYLSGVNLSPGQMKQMLDLGYTARENAWDAARSTSTLYGVPAPPNAESVYKKRDPNARVYDKPEAQVIYARDPQGKLHQAPAGTALPKGWTQENR